MDPLSTAILEIAKTLNVPPVTAAVMIPLVIAMANRAARLIPDTATGPLKWLRIAMVVIGLHVKDNSGVPATTDATGAAIRRADPDNIPESTDDQGALLLDDSYRPNIFGRGAAANANREG